MKEGLVIVICIKILVILKAKLIYFKKILISIFKTPQLENNIIKMVKKFDKKYNKI